MTDLPPCPLPPGHPSGEAKHRRTGCKCPETRDATNEAQRRRHRERAYGTRPVIKWVDPNPARDHLLEALDGEPVTNTLAAAVGVSAHSLRRLVRGETRNLHSDIEAKILGYVPRTLVSKRLGRIPAIGSTRRLQALAALGWPMTFLEARMPGERNSVDARRACRRLGVIRSGVTQTVPPHEAKAISDLYEKLWNTRPTVTTTWQSGWVIRALKLAEQEGWALPMEWDEGAIDDPDATPYRETNRHADRHPSVEDLIELLDAGKPWEEAATRAGYRSRDSAQRAIRRWRETHEDQELAA